MSTLFPCSSIQSSPAVSFVGAGWDTFSNYAAKSYNLASAQIEGLNRYSVPFTVWDAGFTNDATLGGFLRPVKPDLLPITVPDKVVIPAAPTLNVPTLVIEPAPSEPTDLTPPTFLIPNAPAELVATRPGSAPTLTIPDAPLPPTITTIVAPTLEDIVLPTVPVIDIALFDEVAPVFNEAAPSETLNFTEVLYTSPLIDRVREQITAMMDGKYYLPKTVADALWEQGVSREETSALRQKQEIRDQFGSRGFEEPNGIVAARLMEVTQNTANRRSELGREVYTKTEMVALENLRFAVQNGVSLETTLLQAHLTVEGRRFDLVVKGRDVAIAVFNARVTQFNASIQAFNSRMEAYKAYLDGQRTLVDVYKAQVDAAKVRGDLNESLVKIYAEQVRASLTEAELYRAQIEGFRSVIEAEKAKIDGYRSEVEGYNSFIDAYKTEWDAYRARLQVEVEKGNIYETMYKIYNSRINAWQTKGNMAIAQNDSYLKQSEATIRTFEANVRAVLGQLEGTRTLIQAQSASNDASARIYTAEATVEAAAVEADTRAFNALLEQSRIKVELALRDAGLQIEQSTKIAGLLLEAMKSGAQASSQLAASSFSAVSFGANVSDSTGYSIGCSQSINYSGEIADLS